MLKTALIAILLVILLIPSAYGDNFIAAAKSASDTTPVTLTGKVVTSGNSVFQSKIYIEEPDRQSGIQIYIGSTHFPDAVEGAIVTVVGQANHVGIERVIRNATITVTDSRTPLLPLAMQNKAVGGGTLGSQVGVKNGVGLNNVGLLVRTCGFVTAVDTTAGTATIDDGSRSPVLMELSHLTTNPSVDDFVYVTGISALKAVNGDTSNLTSFIKPRRDSDVVAHTPTFEERIEWTHVGPNNIALFWLGQGGFLIKDGQGHKIAVDPYLSDYCRYMVGSEWVRLLPVPILPSHLKPDLTLVTHDHGDHTDPWTIMPIYQSCDSVFWGPTASYNHMGQSDCGSIPASRRVKLDRGQTATWNGIQITALYANHTSDSVGFLLQIAGRRLYISGDTLYDQTLVNAVSAQHPDIMICCINGKMGNMGSSEAASLVKTCGASIAIPMHYAMFAVNTTDPQNFVNACISQGVTAQVIVLPNFGFTIL